MEKDLGLKSTGTAAKKGAASKKAKQLGMKLPRFFTTPGVDPADELAWEHRSAGITGEDGKAVFEQKDIEIPKTWSMLATNVVASKYFRGTPGTPERETSRAQAGCPCGRHHHPLGRAGRLLRRRRRSRGVPRRARPTCSCARRSPSTRRSGSTSASKSTRSARPASSTRSRTRWSPSSTWRRPRACSSSTARAPDRTSPRCALRSELLAGGGTASGPVSFMKGFDAFAGVIKSGGKTRRAAKMVILERRSPRHPRVHPLQGERGEEGLGADRRRLRRLLQRRGLRVDLLPELEQLGPRHRRVHEGGGRGQAVDHPRGAATASRWTRIRRAISSARSPRPPTSAATRACSSTPRSTAGTPARTPRASTRRTRAPSTCSSTTRPAIWRR